MTAEPGAGPMAASADDSSMGANASARRPASTAVGTSPKAKRETAPAPGATPDIPHVQLVGGVHRMLAQANQDEVFFKKVHEAVNGHAETIEMLKLFVKTLSADPSRCCTTTPW